MSRVCNILAALVLWAAAAPLCGASQSRTPEAEGRGVELSLEQCRQMAEQNSVAVKNAGLDLLAAKAQKGEALAEYFPSVSLNAFGFYAIDPLLEIGFEDVLGSSANSQAIIAMAQAYGIGTTYSTLQHGYGGSIALRQPVFAGGRIVAGNHLAALGVEAAQLQKSLQLRKSADEAEESYWQTVSLQEKLVTAQTVGALLDTLAKDLDSAVSAGLATESDKLELQLQINELRSTISRLKGGVRLSKMNLCNSIGMGYSPYSTIQDGSVPYIDDIVLTGDLDSLPEPAAVWMDENLILQEREETRLLDLSVRSKTLEKKMVRGEVLPQVGLEASYGYSSLITDGRFNGAVFATVKVPVTDWGKYSRRLQRYDYQVQKAQNERDELMDKMLLQVRQAWLDVTVTWEQVEVARESVAVAQSSVDRLMSHYKAGLVPFSDLLQAQTSLRRSADALTDSRIAYRNALNTYLSLSSRPR